MSKVSQELKVLLYLNQRYSRTKFVSVSELADYLEVSTRQARRYIEDLYSVPGVRIKTRLGRDGGYRLETPLDKGLALPENVVLAISLAMRRNSRIEEELATLPNYVITDTVAGDNEIDNEVLDNLEIIIKAISDQKELSLKYGDKDDLYLVQPYKVLYTNRSYYLYLVHDDEIKKFDVKKIRELKILSRFKPNKEITKEIESRSTRYGIKDGKETKLRVRCLNQNTLRLFEKYFEGKGVVDEEKMTFEVLASSENELYYPLFRVGSKGYVFLDEDFKQKYIKYLADQISSIRWRNK